MELMEGETLKYRLRGGPGPGVNRIAKQGQFTRVIPLLYVPGSKRKYLCNLLLWRGKQHVSAASASEASVG